jgi:hypothetical protein
MWSLGPSTEPDKADTLIWDSQTWDLGESKYLSFKSPHLWHFAMAVPVDQVGPPCPLFPCMPARC